MIFIPINSIKIFTNRQTYVTSKPFESIDKLKKGQSIYEIALGVSQYDLIQSALEKSLYESNSSLDTPVLPPPPSLPQKYAPSIISQIQQDYGENKDFSDKNLKAQGVGKGIDLVAEADNNSYTNEGPIYAICNFDSN